MAAIWQLRAHNTDTASENKIHDDEVARRFGFSGGLVPGVEVYAYMTHVPAAMWGVDWLERGTMRARFLQPVYDGSLVAVIGVPPDDEATIDHDDEAMGLEVQDEGGAILAVGAATLPAVAGDPPSADHWPDVPEVGGDARPPASPETLAVGTAFGRTPHHFRADKAGTYLDDVRDDLLLYRDDGIAHPGWLLREANYVLGQNVRLGPWIHVESVTTHFRLVRDGALVSARALVTREWEHKGHRFVELDVALLADGEVAARSTHTAIYRPRQVAEAG
jgi:acyl-coenzyme A thioesterase PaaI-like protein